MRAGSVTWLCHHPGMVMWHDDGSALQDKIVSVSGVNAFPILTVFSLVVVNT